LWLVERRDERIGYLGFETIYIKGAVEYYKGNVRDGDKLTPCAFGDE